MKAETDQPFESVTRNEYSWTFAFGGRAWFRADGWWRLLREGRVLWASGDDQQWFGLDRPVDLEAETAEKLGGERLSSVDVDDLTGDLTLELTSGYSIQIPTISRGYESYGFGLNGHDYVGTGGGELHVVIPTAQPQVFTSGRLLGGFGTKSPQWEEEWSPPMP